MQGIKQMRVIRGANTFDMPNALTVLCARVSHKKNLFISLRPRAHMNFSRRRVDLCSTLVHCDYGAQHNFSFCKVLLACFAFSSMRRDSVSLNFAMHIDLSISLHVLLKSATRTRL